MSSLGKGVTAGKRPRWETSNGQEFWAPASPTVLSPAESDASSRSTFSGCPGSDDFEPPLCQQKRFKPDPQYRCAPSSCDSSTFSRPSLPHQEQVSSASLPHPTAAPPPVGPSGWQHPHSWHQRGIPLSGGFDFRRAEAMPGGVGFASSSLARSHSCLGSLLIASSIATNFKHQEGSRLCSLAPTPAFSMDAYLPMASSSNNTYSATLQTRTFSSLRSTPGKDRASYRPSQSLQPGPPFPGIRGPGCAPKRLRPAFGHFLFGSAPTFLQANFLRAELQNTQAQQVNHSAQLRPQAMPTAPTAWLPAARLPQLQRPPTTAKDMLAEWGSLLRLSPDTLFFTEHLFTRLRPKHFLGQLDWTTVLLLLGCLWIACKLEECRLSLPTAHTVASLVASSLGVAISAALVSAVEVKVLGLLKWRPLAGWDDFTHVKGRLLATPHGAW